MNAGVRTCSMCQKMFKYKGYDLCPVCLERLDTDYVIVRDYLYEHPSAGIQELKEETKVDEKIILHLVRAGRLSFAEGADTGIHCSSCGRPIISGKMCDKCAKSMSKTLTDALPPEVRDKFNKKPLGPESKAAKGVRMHTFDRRTDE